MPLREFERILDTFPRRFDSLGLSDFGEPLIHPHFPEFARACWRRGVRYNITTNGQHTTDEIIRAIHIYPPQEINWSLYATTQEAYEFIFPGGDVEKTKANLRRLLRTMAPRTVMRLRTIPIPALRGQAENIMKEFPNCQYDFDNWLDSWAGRVDVSHFDPEWKKHTARSAHCLQPWWHCWINSAGGIMTCNVLDEPIGHVDDGLMNVWNGNAYREVRRNILAGKRVGRCEGCDYRNNMTGW